MNTSMSFSWQQHAPDLLPSGLSDFILLLYLKQVHLWPPIMRATPVLRSHFGVPVQTVAIIKRTVIKSLTYFPATSVSVSQYRISISGQILIFLTQKFPNEIDWQRIPWRNESRFLCSIKLNLKVIVRRL